jgi:hypothetical protein
MSSLPPISPRLALNPAPTANAAAVRDARAMFFKALGEVPAAAPPAAKPAMAAPSTMPPPPRPLAAAVTTLSAEDAARPRRPGSLLNILV